MWGCVGHPQAMNAVGNCVEGGLEEGSAVLLHSEREGGCWGFSSPEPIIAAGTTSYHLEFLVTSLTSVVITLHLRFTRQQISDFPPWNWACPQGPSSSVSSLNFPFSSAPPPPWARCSPPRGSALSWRSGFPSGDEPRATSWPPRCSCTASPNTCCSSARPGQTAFSAFELSVAASTPPPRTAGLQGQSPANGKLRCCFGDVPLPFWIHTHLFLYIYFLDTYPSFFL